MDFNGGCVDYNSSDKGPLSSSQTLGRPHFETRILVNAFQSRRNAYCGGSMHLC